MGRNHDTVIAFLTRHSTYVRYLLPAVSIMLTLAETCAYPPHEALTLVLVIAHIAALALMVFRPLLGGNIILISFVICCLLPDDSGPSLLWGTWLALAYMGRYTDPPYGAIYPLAVSAARMWRFETDSTPSSEYVMLLLAMFLAFFVGRAISWRDLAHQAEQNALRAEVAQRHLAMVRKEHIAANRIHDSVTGNLTYMAMLLDSKSLTQDHTLTEEEITALRATIITTLEEVRTVITVLSGDDDASDVEAANGMATADAARETSYIGRLHAIAEQGDRSLAKMGFSGKTNLSADLSKDLPEHLDRERRDELESLLQELYTNIAVHAKPNGEYHISVSCDGCDGCDDCDGDGDEDGRRTAVTIRIDQVNETSNDSLFPDKPTSGNGLRLHEERIRDLGGSARNSAEDGTWQFHACIPIIPAIPVEGNAQASVSSCLATQSTM